MKKRITVFLSVAAAVLLVAPVVNLLSLHGAGRQKWGEMSLFYNLDFVQRGVSRILFPLGISTAPNSVVIGRDGWLYSGDRFAQTISRSRRTPTVRDLADGKEVLAAWEAWNDWLLRRNVKLLRIAILPNKEAVYPEHVPKWAQPASRSVADALVAESELYSMPNAALLAAKQHSPVDLYFKTDSHWNQLGAAVAFHDFARQVGASDPSLRWPDSSAYQLAGVTTRAGGDLTYFFHMADLINDPQPAVLADSFAIETIQYDLDSGKELYRGGNPIIKVPRNFVLVKSPSALNRTRVLWVRDSFGEGLSRLMAITFSDVVQIHWSDTLKVDGRFADVVESWKPNYVFVTVVDRNSLANELHYFPPSDTIPAQQSDEVVSLMEPAQIHDLAQKTPQVTYEVTGDDPSVEYETSASFAANQSLRLNLRCDGGAPVRMQLFWRITGARTFDEWHSTKFFLKPGNQILSLRDVAKWDQAASIDRLRLDIDQPDRCKRFTLASVAVVSHK